MRIDYAVTIIMGKERQMLVISDTNIKDFTEILIDNRIPFECCIFCENTEENINA